jgi:hypothetical protein
MSHTCRVLGRHCSLEDTYTIRSWKTSCSRVANTRVALYWCCEKAKESMSGQTRLGQGIIKEINVCVSCPPEVSLLEESQEINHHHVLAHHTNTTRRDKPSSPLPHPDRTTPSSAAPSPPWTHTHLANPQHAHFKFRVNAVSTKTLHKNLAHNGPPPNTPHPGPTPLQLPTPHRAHARQSRTTTRRDGSYRCRR